MSADSASAALSQVRDLITAAGPNPSLATKRNIYEHLISLCSYQSLDAKLFFGTLVAKYFAECEDLQDRAIDAILDLCEDDDEKTRTIGIRGLGSTAKADTRWVRGNTGVLLQLLECPPRELKLVHEALFTLLSVSPVDVFAVMADDCRGSEEETGASRRNILDFLQLHCQQARQDTLESGRNLEAEETFRKGFEAVMETTAIAETRLILGLILPLSTVSGENATVASTSRFVRTVTKSLHAGSSSALTQPLVKLFAELCHRTSKMDGREALGFWAEHGSATLILALDREDKYAKELVGKLEGHVNSAVKSWKGKEKADAELSEDKVVLPVVISLLKPVLDNVDRSKSFVGKHVPALETVLHAVYQLMLLTDRRRELKEGVDAKSLRDLHKDAKRLSPQTSERRAADNLAAMIELLEEPSKPLRDITPSWLPELSAKTASTAAYKSRTLDIRERPTRPTSTPTGPSASREQKPPAPALSAVPSGGHAIRPTQQHGEKTPMASTAPRSSLAGQSGKSGQPTDPSRPSEGGARANPLRSMLSQNGGQGSALATSQAKERLSGLASNGARPGRELLPKSTSTPQPPGPSRNGSTASIGSSTPSLASRLGTTMRQTSGQKRTREDEAPSTEESPRENGPSLLRRIAQSSQPITPAFSDAKRQRGDAAGTGLVQSTSIGLSLLSRIGKGDTAGNGGRPPSPAPVLQTASAQPKPISFLGRSQTPSAPTPTPAPVIQAPPAPAASSPKVISVLNAAKTSVAATPSAALSIRSASVAPVDVDHGIVRKGRGFNKADEDGDLIMMPSAASPVMPPPGMQQRFGGGRPQINRNRARW